MSLYISETIRKQVANRANFRCEFDRHSLFPFHIDHIISLKYGGENIFDNLAFSCSFCNINKGTDLGTYINDTSVLIRFYNPRKDIWSEHFQIDNSGLILPKTQIGEATIKIFDTNHIDSVIERKELIMNGLF